MAQPETPTQASGAGTEPYKFTTKNTREPCALMAQDASGPVVAATPSLGFDTKLGARLYAMRSGNANNPWLGFTISFPLGENQTANEAAGFGVRSKSKSRQIPFPLDSFTRIQYANSFRVVDPGSMKVERMDSHEIEVRLPRGGYTREVKDAPAEVQARLSQVEAARKGISVLTVRLNADARVQVNGFGIPFSNVEDDELNRQVNEYSPIFGSTTLLSILRQREFVLVVALSREVLEKLTSESWLPPPFAYPYGEKHEWDPERLWKAHLDNRAKAPFRAAYSYDDDNSHVAVVAHFNAQESLWLDQAATAIRAEKFPAYFVPKDPELADPADSKCRFYVIIPMTEGYRVRHQQVWAQLTRDGTCKLGLGPAASGKGELKWYVPQYHHLPARY